jgi:deoxyribodipyrimidine photo-lyase
MAAPILLWFRRDLRLGDHAALAAAVATGRPIVPVYILDDDTPSRWRIGGAGHWWLAGSLRALGEALETRGSRLILRKGRFEPTLLELAKETGATAVHFTRGYEPYMVGIEDKLAAALGNAGVECRRFAGTLLNEPESLRTKSGEPFKMFTPFYKAARAREPYARALRAPGQIPAPESWPESEASDDWALKPTRPDWAGGMRDSWEPGEAGAGKRLRAFIANALDDYGKCRDLPGADGTSRLSPHLAFGEISPRQLWHAIRHAGESEGLRGAEAYIREMYWREFSYHLLVHWPDLPEKPFRPVFADFPWNEDGKALAAWRRGRTGYPIVDAGMRQLWTIGWMHNRVRMIAASLLIKHLLVRWTEGEAWFWDTLVDADLANNAASWQWVAGSGADAAPYFRIFNPVLQGRKFDPDGRYVRYWVPELAALPDRHIHAPWEAPDDVLRMAGVDLGGIYPLPIIDHGKGRARALAAFRQISGDGPAADPLLGDED